MKTTRRCLCKTISFLLALSILFCCCPIVPLADGSVHSGGRSTPMRDPSSPYWDDFWGINPTDAELEAAMTSGCAAEVPLLINGSVDGSYELDIHHFVPSESGYYVIYTTYTESDWLDTIGAIYEVSRIAGQTSYECIAYDDEGSSLVTQDEFDWNFRMLVELKAGCDYLICVRGALYEFGEYRLFIEPNLDSLVSTDGGVWEAQPFQNSWIAYSKTTQKMHYLTKEQALLNYILSMDGVVYDLEIHLEDGQEFDLAYITQVYNEDPSRAAQVVDTVIQGVLGMVPVIGFTVTSLGMVLDIIEIYSDDSEDQRLLAQIIHETCDIHAYASVIPEGVMMTMVINHGLLVETKASSGSTLEFEFYAYDDTTLYGKEYYYGIWN